MFITLEAHGVTLAILPLLFHVNRTFNEVHDKSLSLFLQHRLLQ
ncbi:hypothetical protein [Acinetobacter sp.]